jgi:hypothetical protein
MDVWEEKMIKMMAMPEEEQTRHRRKLMNMCICRDCPSYKGTGETQVLFCSVGKSSVIAEERGCTCGGCPVTPQMGLTKLYYCTKGNEAQQREVSM